MKTLFILVFFNALNAIATDNIQILSNETTYEILASDEVKIIEYSLIKINSAEGKRYSYFTEIIDKYRKLKNVEIVIKNSTGKQIKKLNKSDAREYGFNQSYEIDDSKIFVIDPEFQQYPFTMEIKSEMVIRGFISLPTWVPRSNFGISVSMSKLNIKHAKNIGVRIREENIEKSDTYSDDKFTYIKYQVSNLEAIDKTLRYKEFYNDQPKVMISPEKFSLDNYEGDFTTWSKFGDWFIELNDSEFELTKETKEFIDGLSEANNKATIAKIYKYMQERTRYISIQLGIGGYKSMATELVEKDGYGDCKALTTYMKNMLDYAGIPSNYILVRAGKDAPDIIAEFPSNQFNHVYLGIPSTDTLYLECTSQSIPPFYTGQFTDDRNVLWVEKGKSQIIRSKVYSMDDNIQRSSAKIQINDIGDAEIHLNIANEGIFYDELMTFESGSEDYIKRHNQSKFWYRDFTITDFKFEKNSEFMPVFTSDYVIDVKGLAKKLGDRLILPINALTPISDVIDESELKKYAAIPRAITITDQVTFDLPGNFWIYNLPEEVEIESDYGSYFLQVEANDNKGVIINRSIKLNKGEYLKEEYEKFNEFYKKLVKAEKKKLILNSKT